MMRDILRKSLIACVLSLLSHSITAETHPEIAPSPGSKAFERMKKLVGHWNGSATMSKEGEVVSVEYELTSAGSLLVEKLFPGTPHEMVSTYYDDHGKLAMTHYCALKNQPRMRLTKAQGDTLSFNFVSGRNLDPEKDPHIHQLFIDFVNDDEIEQQWTMFANGKRAGVNKLNLTRAR